MNIFKKSLRVYITYNNGRIEVGYAEPMKDGYCIKGPAKILTAYGENGKFPLGNPWGWYDWEFVK